MKAVVLFTGGKDSCYALHEAVKQGYEPILLIMKSRNPDSWMYHAPVDLADFYSEITGFKTYIFETAGIKEEEVEDLYKVLKEIKEKEHFEAIFTGAIASRYQRDRVLKVAERLGVKVVNPLWGIDPAEYMRRIVRQFEILIIKAAAEGMDRWLGVTLNEDNVEELLRDAAKYRFHAAFEGGEAETLVLDAPLFKKRIVIEEAEKEGNVLRIKKFKLVDKA